MQLDIKPEESNVPDMTRSDGLGLEEVIYTRRFSDDQDKLRSITWKVLGRDFFTSYLNSESTVVDLGSGDGLFLKSISAKRKIAVDISPHSKALEALGIEVISSYVQDIPKEYYGCADVVMMSNFLEHLPSKAILLDVLKAARNLLSPTGKLLILQPNIKYVGGKYWDYIDHHIALTENSLTEALDITGYSVSEVIPRFLPYTAKSRLADLITKYADPEKLVTTYLKFPILWDLFGGQSFIVASYNPVHKDTV